MAVLLFLGIAVEKYQECWVFGIVASTTTCIGGATAVKQINYLAVFGV
jgi:hypothetical protein